MSVLKPADLVVREDFSLGPLRVSPALRTIKGPAGEAHVEPLIMQVFLLLADAKGQVVTRNHLFDECWGGIMVGDESLNRAITMVRRIAAETAPGGFRVESIPRTGYRLLVSDLSHRGREPAQRKWRTHVLVSAGIITLIAIGSSTWILLDRSPEEPTVAISAAADPQSAELADNISRSAMTTAATYETPLRLVGGSNAKKARADFVLEVQDAQVRGGRKVEIRLLSREDSSLLWSWSGSEPVERSASLDQLARGTAAAVVACAAETRVDAVRPDLQTVQLYLNACSTFESRAGADLALLADAFRRVTVRAPQLRGAWAKLFLSTAEATDFGDPMGSLKQDISNARAHHIDIPELYAAIALTLPPNARFERLRLCDEMLARHPSSAFLLIARSWLLRTLGRMDEAAMTARKVAALYPDSPAANTEYVNSLMSSGRIEAARSVLERATKLAPDAPNLKWARWRLEMRYGDPKAALELAHSGDAVVETSTINFLQARLDPTKANVDRAIRGFIAGYNKSRDPSLLAQALGAFGRTEDAIQLLLHFDGSRSGDMAEDLFRPHMRQVRHDPRFILIAQNFGMTDDWIRSGILPDFCFEPDLPYDCKRELAKLSKT